jgi:hypothetical protein
MLQAPAGHALELFRRSPSSPCAEKCPKCGKAGLERQIGAGAAILVPPARATTRPNYNRHDAYKKSARGGGPTTREGRRAPRRKAPEKAAEQARAKKPAEKPTAAEGGARK